MFCLKFICSGNINCMFGLFCFITKVTCFETVHLEKVYDDVFFLIVMIVCYLSSGSDERMQAKKLNQASEQYTIADYNMSTFSLQLGIAVLFVITYVRTKA